MIEVELVGGALDGKMVKVKRPLPKTLIVEHERRRILFIRRSDGKYGLANQNR